ncbi:MAG: hypothetical protein EP329_03030 [Deltaproteobacteria bacterium]|nr:MAG: hypothetical protein EP329_03030 [Deltaproteobacteria bacterium]
MSDTHDKNAPAELNIVSEYTDGGHEIDRPPAITLFGFLVAMGVIIVISAIFVFQLFASQSDDEQAKLGSEPIAKQVAQAERDAMFKTTYGIVTDAEGQQTGYRMPIDVAKKLVLEQPARFAPAPPPIGWVHPDDAVAPAPAPDQK